MRIINVVNGNLFQIASVELGNALQWISIAKANNLTDPEIIGPTEISIPPPSFGFFDGIGSQ